MTTTSTSDAGVGPSAGSGVRTMLRMRALPGREAEFAAAWQRAAEVIRRVPGCLRQDLMHDPDDPRAFVILAEWSSRAALDAFGRGPRRDFLTAALRDLRESAERSTYEVLSSLEGDGQGVRVLITTTVPAGGEAAFESAYLEVAEAMRGTPGHVREELLHEPGTQTYHLLAEWSSQAAFLAWVSDPRHTDSTGPLIPYLTKGFQRRIFTIAARPEESVASVPTPLAGPPPATTARAERPRSAANRAGPAGPAGHGSTPADTDVLVVGAGPTGMTLALELARRGVDLRLVEQSVEPPSQADKAIGVHCRTMEIWEDQGIVQPAIDAGIWLDGQIVVVNGRQTHKVNWDLPELTYAHLGLPQYETERILTDRLASLGVTIERGVALRGFRQDDTGVTARLSASGAGGGEQTGRASYVVGCDGAHSAVRKGLGLAFEAGAGRFPQLFMLADVEVDWELPERHLIRFMHETDGEMDGMLVCVPLKGNGRYRMATMAPPRVMAEAAGKDVPPGFMKELDPPTLEEFQVAIDRLAPPGTRARNLRWSSIFRISHGLVDRYRVGRVFVAGDAAHLHPPAGGQGMNTGIQDAYNLGWKLATAVAGKAAPNLLDSYEAERRPAASSIVGRAVRIAFTDEMDHDDSKAQFLHEMQLTTTYHGTPWVGEALGWDAPDSGPAAGDRAPDLGGLRRRGVGHPMRLFELTAGIRHTLLLYADSTTTTEDLRSYEKLASGVRQHAPGLVDVYLVAAPDLPGTGAGGIGVDLPLVHDAAGEYRAVFASTGPCAYLVRPDGHVGFRTRPVLAGALEDHFRKIFAP